MSQVSISSAADQSFANKKHNILRNLSTPLSEYKDRSPKGSVDEAIRDLIDEINSADGIVTTSSCAGRVSVFLEGEKAAASNAYLKWEGDEEQIHSDGRERLLISGIPNSIGKIPEHKYDDQPSARPKTPKDTKSIAPGGKGHGGHWLYVSHSPIPPTSASSSSSLHYHNLFGLRPQFPEQQSYPLPSPSRLVRLQFEPLLLHILCASLPHASAPLSAAISSGFRESGLQTLSCLENPMHHPMVGIRSSGLSFTSVIGYLDRDSIARSLVSETYLETMVQETTHRFAENIRRKERFSSALRARIPNIPRSGSETTNADGNNSGDQHPILHDLGTNQLLNNNKSSNWEDPKTRAFRKRAEGLKRKEELQSSSRDIDLSTLKKSNGQTSTPPFFGDLTDIE